jgi:hypothetical protein
MLFRYPVLFFLFMVVIADTSSGQLAVGSAQSAFDSHTPSSVANHPLPGADRQLPTADWQLPEKSGVQLSLRTNPLSFIESDANVMLGLGIQWDPQLAVTFEPAYIFARLYDGGGVDNGDESDTRRASGIKLRTDFRLYFTPFNYSRGAFFFGPEFHYKYVNTWIPADFGINCSGANCAYTQRAEYKETKEEFGGLLKFGLNAPLYRDRLAIEVFAGLGLKTKWRQESGIPVGGSFINPPGNNRTAFTPPYEGWMMMLPMGTKLSFRLN